MKNDRTKKLNEKVLNLKFTKLKKCKVKRMNRPEFDSINWDLLHENYTEMWCNSLQSVWNLR